MPLLLKLRFAKADYREVCIAKIGSFLVRNLVELGPAFIKLGQVLSTRQDLVGKNLGSMLSQLEDRIPQVDFSKISRLLDLEISQERLSEIEYIENTAVAAASIAQVHKAQLKDGTQIAFKFLRPGISKKFYKNLKTLRALSKIYVFIFKSAKKLKFEEIIPKIESIAAAELDMRLEAAAADKLRENCKNDKFVYIPKVYWRYTKKSILALEWVDGLSLKNKEDISKLGLSFKEITRRLAITFFNQAFRDGFFHADLHKGNIFINKSGQIVLVDFGIVESLADRDRMFVAQIIDAFVARDYCRVANMYFRAGYVPNDQSRYKFELACRSIGESIFDAPVSQISISELLKQLLEITREFSMPTQAQLLMLQKTMLTVEGVGYFLYPEVNMWYLIRPWIKDWAKKNLSYRCKFRFILKHIFNIL
ncbi:putative protein kinase UbiB [Candidatus Cyrtobacter comes]|uniref:Protein kinase domain-containing protein n=1 Tax=Candidatus Cyrtobacter comes TaxID=675776 RepID=A0ABU5L8W1_9RICK|nr:putative protein kinase UbiB [Candidatus Cyrtobacter comes]